MEAGNARQHFADGSTCMKQWSMTKGQSIRKLDLVDAMIDAADDLVSDRLKRLRNRETR